MLAVYLKPIMPKLAAGAEKFLGLPAQQIRHRTVREALGEDRYRTVQAHFERARQGQIVQYEWTETPPPPSGEPRHFAVHLFPRTGGSARPDGFYALATDITETWRLSPTKRIWREELLTWTDYDAACRAYTQLRRHRPGRLHWYSLPTLRALPSGTSLGPSDAVAVRRITSGGFHTQPRWRSPPSVPRRKGG